MDQVARTRLRVRAIAGSLLILALAAGAVLALTLSLMRLDSPALLAMGRAAPDFALHDQDNRLHEMSGYREHPVILAFFPAITPLVAQELRSLRETISAFDRAGAKVFGITRDAHAAKAFHDEEHLPFPILGDPNGLVARAYGAQGRDGQLLNVSFVADTNQKIVLALPEALMNRLAHGPQLLHFAACCLMPSTEGPDRSGEIVRNFQLPRVDDGRLESLIPATKPRAIVVEFLSAHCPCSQGYDERMRALAAAYLPEGVRFLGINACADESVEVAADHARRARIPFPVVKDPGCQVADRMRAQITPEVFLLDGDGVIRYHGRIDDSRDPASVQKQELKDALDVVLAGRYPKQGETRVTGCAFIRTLALPSSR